MSRAFAAEFLAPKEMLRQDLSGSWVTEEEIDDLATEYGVSPFVIRHQVENHNLAHVA
jgi:Zn-dependent peptidase ImmA (M78 family)